jgi:hypothetical protein
MICLSVEYICSKLGHCFACVRKCFVAALFLWVCAMLIGWFGGHPSSIHLAAETVATALTLLWLAHIVAIAYRRSSSLAKNVKNEHAASRRALLGDFATFLGGVAILSAFPGSAFACQTDFCDNQNPCCPGYICNHPHAWDPNGTCDKSSPSGSTQTSTHRGTVPAK